MDLAQAHMSSQDRLTLANSLRPRLSERLHATGLTCRKTLLHQINTKILLSTQKPLMLSVFLRRPAATKSNCLSKDKFLVNVSATTRSAVISKDIWLNLFSVELIIRARKSRITVSQDQVPTMVRSSIIHLASELCLTLTVRAIQTTKILMLKNLSLWDLNATHHMCPLMCQRVLKSERALERNPNPQAFSHLLPLIMSSLVNLNKPKHTPSSIWV
jgi:hypothetical protein